MITWAVAWYLAKMEAYNGALFALAMMADLALFCIIGAVFYGIFKQ